MRITDIFQAITIIVLFCLVYSIIRIIIYIDLFKSNWQGDQCDPVNMFIAQLFGIDGKANMENCVKREQEKNHDINLSAWKGEVTNAYKQIANVNKRSNILHDRMKSISNINLNSYLGFGNILNSITLQVQIIISQLQDVFGKMGSVVVLMMYIMNGFTYTVTSLRNTPFGKFLGLKTDSEACFHPDTRIRLENGNYVYIRDIKIGDTLYSGSRVIATLKIIGNHDDPNNPYFALYSNKLKSFIYVTGTHYIENQDTIIQVKYHPLAVIEENIVSTEMYCLVTDDHYIPVGEYKFMDWEY